MVWSLSHSFPCLQNLLVAWMHDIFFFSICNSNYNIYYTRYIQSTLISLASGQCKKTSFRYFVTLVSSLIFWFLPKYNIHKLLLHHEAVMLNQVALYYHKCLCSKIFLFIHLSFLSSPGWPTLSSNRSLFSSGVFPDMLMSSFSGLGTWSGFSK